MHKKVLKNKYKNKREREVLLALIIFIFGIYIVHIGMDTSEDLSSRYLYLNYQFNKDLNSQIVDLAFEEDFVFKSEDYNKIIKSGSLLKAFSERYIYSNKMVEYNVLRSEIEQKMLILSQTPKDTMTYNKEYYVEYIFGNNVKSLIIYKMY